MERHGTVLPKWENGKSSVVGSIFALVSLDSAAAELLQQPKTLLAKTPLASLRVTREQLASIGVDLSCSVPNSAFGSEER